MCYSIETPGVCNQRLKLKCDKLVSKFAFKFQLAAPHHGGVRFQQEAVRFHGRAVQIDPIKPTLKPPGTKRLKLKCDILLSSSAFKSNLHHYTMVDSLTSMDLTGAGRRSLTLCNPH
jgi:hypothetical protein